MSTNIIKAPPRTEAEQFYQISAVFTDSNSSITSFEGAFVASDTIKISASDTMNPGMISYVVNIPGRLSAPHIAVGTYGPQRATAPPDITPASAPYSLLAFPEQAAKYDRTECSSESCPCMGNYFKYR